MNSQKDIRNCPKCGKNLFVLKASSRVEHLEMTFCSKQCVELFEDERERTEYYRSRRLKKS